jgi:hypothetical protein
MQMQLPSNLRDFYHRENIAIQSGVGLFYFLTSFEIQQWANDNFVSRNPWIPASFSFDFLVCPLPLVLDAVVFCRVSFVIRIP